MIDTFEITLIAGHTVVDLMGEGLAKEIRFKDNFCKLTNPLRQPGVRAINITRQKNSNKYSISVEINPTELIEEAASIELFQCSKENVEALKQALNKVLISIHANFSLKQRSWQLSRVDYALQFYTPHVELYTVLESKGSIPYRFEGLQKPGSTYNKCKSSRFNAYNKGDQLSKTNCPESLKKMAKNLYRCEYQCFNPKYLSKKYNVDQFGLFREDIAISVLESQHGRHIKGGDYYTYDEAAKRINEMKGKQQQTKEQMIEVLKFIKAVGSLSNSLQAIQNDTEIVPERFRGAQSGSNYDRLKDTFNEFIREHLCKEGINPVLLPSDSDINLLQNTSSRLFTA
ncbi:hypothetical protein [Sporosarcina sp. FA15]|uniref:hypothetical protein n=1 Tax=Sporosarcina sp. FA15 TaxID=3413031 RepID=UPI003F65ECE6